MKKSEETTIQRFFYPIGQGAFYAEKHQMGNEKFTIVYDCGTCRNCKSGQLKFSDEVIEKAFKKDELIDIFFISHFDYDHVSKIKKLKEHTQIKKVIMPLLYDNERYLLSNIYRVLKFKNIVPLLENPKKFFGEGTDIIKIKPTDNNEVEFPPMILNKEMNGIILESGQPLQIKSDSNWVFIPYNHEYSNRHKELIQKLYNEGFNDKEIKSLQDGTQWTPERIGRERVNNKETITSKKIVPIDDNRIEVLDTKIFKKIYNTLSKHGKNTKINENSMLLYSGTITTGKFKKKSYSYDLDKEMRYGISIQDDRVSCIYTGDTTLNIVEIKKVFRNFWNMVGTIQIPHHGDKESFVKNILDDKGYCCPISVGTNPYNHPSKDVIEDIIGQDSYPLLISEDLGSGFVEFIDNKAYIKLTERKKNLGIFQNLYNLT